MERERQGQKVRSRALTNTLFARLFLADLFVHGIGGGKYDELTDDIIRRFYGCEPPAFLVLSATRLLPLPAVPVGGQIVAAWRGICATCTGTRSAICRGHAGALRRRSRESRR